MAERQCAELLASRSNEWIIANHEATCSQSDHGCEHSIKVAVGALPGTMKTSMGSSCPA
jgi:hypothetical protein